VGHQWLEREYIRCGNVEKSRQRLSLPSPSLLRRSGFGYEGRERLRAGRSPFCRAHVLEVRSARQNRCGLPFEWLRTGLDDFFDHSRRLLALKSSRAYTGFLREIFNRPVVGNAGHSPEAFRWEVGEREFNLVCTFWMPASAGMTMNYPTLVG